jgi:hypothetical protein
MRSIGYRCGLPAVGVGDPTQERYHATHNREDSLVFSAIATNFNASLGTNILPRWGRGGKGDRVLQTFCPAGAGEGKATGSYKHSAPLGQGRGRSPGPTNILPRWGREEEGGRALQTFVPLRCAIFKNGSGSLDRLEPGSQSLLAWRYPADSHSATNWVTRSAVRIGRN